MRVVRSAGQNVSPSDDGRLFDQIFSDGLFTETAFATLGANNVQIGAMYGDLCGRDFTIEQQTITVPLPESDSEATGYIYVEIDTSAENPLSVGASLAPFTPTYEDINVNGAVAQMIVAEYTATPLAVSSVAASYARAAVGSVHPGSIATVETSPVVANHAIGDYILYGGTVYRVTATIAVGGTIVPGSNVIAENVGDALTALNNGLIIQFPSTGWTTTETVNGTTYYTQTVSVTSVSGKPIIGITPISGTLPTSAEQDAFDSVKYFTANDTANTIKAYATSAPTNNFAVVVKGAR